MKVSEEYQPLSLPEKCEETPLRRAIHLLGDTWVLLIVMNLLQGSMRFNALRTKLGHISSKTLSSRLKLLEDKKVASPEDIKELAKRTGP